MKMIDPTAMSRFTALREAAGKIDRLVPHVRLMEQPPHESRDTASVALEFPTPLVVLNSTIRQALSFLFSACDTVQTDMTERKTRMIELGDAFIAFPGGTGTLEEITEVMSKVSLGHLDAPCILYDLDGYYAGLKALLAHMVEMGLSSPERQSGIYFVKNLDEIKSILKRA